MLPLPASTFTYSYRQSIYDVPVREELRVADDRISIERALSSDIRALEYFGWPGAPQRAGGVLEWRAPANATDRLEIVLTRDGGQTIEAGPRRLALAARFGEDARVTLTGGRRPLFLWLWAMLPWA